MVPEDYCHELAASACGGGLNAIYSVLEFGGRDTQWMQIKSGCALIS